MASDSSPLIHLAAIGRLELLRDFHQDITIPPAVWREVVEQGIGRPGAAEVEAARRAGWLHVVAPTNQSLVHLLQRYLDDGEAEAIALAVEQGADLVLLDEADARQLAEVFGLAKTGVIGILMRAKREAKIASLRAELDRLRAHTGFWIDDLLYRQVLSTVGETTTHDD
ncbi:MAG: DUF3368 domain-containing protein [Chloroflexi bacterium]|nr:DUF3368 domain-containing protein [Chloroflexota bacterium]